jgi:hypothetical protein
MLATNISQLVGVLVLFLILAWVFTGLRVYVRSLIRKNWGADDSLLLAALVSSSHPFLTKHLLNIRCLGKLYRLCMLLLCRHNVWPRPSALRHPK